MPPVVASVWTGPDASRDFGNSKRAFHAPVEAGTLVPGGSRTGRVDVDHIGSENAPDHVQRMKESGSQHPRSIAASGQAAGAKVRDGGSMPNRDSPEQVLNTEHKTTASSPASLAGQEERQGAPADVPFPRFSEPTLEFYEAGEEPRDP
jgi:hypothetical protein